jgi:hypothetical protein
VRCRTDLGFTEAKWAVIDSVVAVKGRLPVVHELVKRVHKDKGRRIYL